MEKEFSLKTIFNLTYPSIIAQATIILVGFIDLFFISKAGTQSIAAISIANITTSTLYNFLDGFKTSSTVLIARYLGAKNNKNVSKIIKIGIIYSCITGIIIAILAYPISIFIYKITTSDPIVKNLGITYLYFRLLAAPFTLLFFSFTGIFLGFKNTIKPLFITFIICLFDGILDYIFIYGKLGFPELGIKGAAIATLLAYAIGTLVSILIFFKDSTTKLYLNLKISTKEIKFEFLKITSEIGLYSGFIRIAIFIFATIFSKLGSDILAAHQITYQIFIATFILPKGFSTATSIIISNLIGAKKIKQILPILIKINTASLIVTCFFCILIYSFSSSIAILFSPTNINVVNNASSTIKLVCISQIFFSIYMVFVGALTAFKDTKFIMYTEFATEYIIFIPLTYLLVIKYNYGVIGGYIAFLNWAAIDATLLVIRFLTNKIFDHKFIPATIYHSKCEKKLNNPTMKQNKI